MTRERERLIGLLVLLLVCVVVETLSFAAGRVLQRRWAMYAPPRPVAAQQISYAEYLERRDPVLGWPYPDEIGGEHFDATGARPSPAFPDPAVQPACVSLYGDSYTQSPQGDEETWGNVLSRRLGCRVANYGVGGYGSDGAFLRFRRNPDDEASVVILSHFSENLMRNLTRNRDLLNYALWYAYKPRFVLDAQGRLQHVPIPSLTLEEHGALIGARSPQLDLEYESFHPGGPAGATQLRFPFTLSILRNFGDFRMQARLARRPSYAALYERGHPLRGLEITTEIGRSFDAEARARGQLPLVMLFPARRDVELYRKTDRWVYQNLFEDLGAAGVDVVEFGSRLVERIGDRDLDDFYDETEHFTAESDRILAEFTYEHLKRLGAPHVAFHAAADAR